MIALYERKKISSIFKKMHVILKENIFPMFGKFSKVEIYVRFLTINFKLYNAVIHVNPFTSFEYSSL